MPVELQAAVTRDLSGRCEANRGYSAGIAGRHIRALAASVRFNTRLAQSRLISGPIHNRIEPTLAMRRVKLCRIYQHETRLTFHCPAGYPSFLCKTGVAEVFSETMTFL